MASYEIFNKLFPGTKLKLKTAAMTLKKKKKPTCARFRLGQKSKIMMSFMLTL
jgi:hypothetical protein